MRGIVLLICIFIKSSGSTVVPAKKQAPAASNSRAARSSEAEANEEEKVLDEKKLFVTNLNFATTDEDLKNHFIGLVGAKNVVNAEVLRRRNGRSAGSACIEFTTADACKKAMAAANNSTLDDRELGVRGYYEK